MRYEIFRFDDYPNTKKALAKFAPDFATQRTTKNLRYYAGVVSFDVMRDLVSKTISFDISADYLDPSAFDEKDLKALRYILEQINEADRIDSGIAYTSCKTLFEVNRTFHYFHQMYGGRRYVALCRDLIDKNMNVSLFPYMYEDLVIGIFTNYNKNTSRDIDGLLEGIVEMLEEIDLSQTVLKSIYSGIGAKCSPTHYAKLVDLCLSSAKLNPSMRELVVDGYVPSRFDGRKCYPNVDVKTLLTFDKEDICALLRGLPGGMRSTVREIFDSFGDTIDPDYASAYLHNPSRDMSLLTEARFFPSLPAETRQEITRGRIFSPNAKKTEIISYFAGVQDDPNAKETVLQACMDFGQEELAKALSGQDFVLIGFSIPEIDALMPYANFETPTMISRLTAYLKRFGMGFVHSESLERVFMSMKAPDYLEAVRYGLEKNCIVDKANRLALVDRFGLVGELGYKEWKYHA